MSLGNDGWAGIAAQGGSSFRLIGGKRLYLVGDPLRKAFTEVFNTKDDKKKIF